MSDINDKKDEILEDIIALKKRIQESKETIEEFILDSLNRIANKIMDL